MKTRSKNRHSHKQCHNKERQSHQLTNRLQGAAISPSPISKTESSDTLSQITIDTERCMMCKKCKRECPSGAITVTDVARVDNTRCIRCGSCIQVCPNQAISFQ
ncbi:4Fe-4S binding protein [Pseudodesulfovibrio nedwellii]|uniref:4Fe-4S binding protein n=1 Tax=Pseudodesulfovibrio nedwellii TaxID=2973072 RepID=UPI00336AAC4D